MIQSCRVVSYPALDKISNLAVLRHESLSMVYVSEILKDSQILDSLRLRSIVIL
jgi:hypothetical protein